MVVISSMAAAGEGEAADPVDSRGAETYVVKPGDTLAAIAEAHDMSMADLADLNGIDNPNVIRLGQELRLRQPTAESGPDRESPAGSTGSDRGPAGAARVHVVKAGDTYAKIAELYAVPVTRLMETNPQVDPKKLRAGQEIRISHPERSADQTPDQAGAVAGEPRSEDRKDGPARVKVVRSEGDFVRSLADPDLRPELKRVKRIEDDSDEP